MYDRRLVAVFLAPSQIHAHQHLCPVLALCASRARIYFQDCAELVLLASQHVAQFHVFKAFDGFLIHLVEFLLSDQSLLHEIKPQFELVDHLFYILVAVNPVVQFLHFAHLLLRRLLVVPEIGHVRAQFLFFDFYFLRVDVKDTSSTPTCVLLSLLIVLA